MSDEAIASALKWKNDFAARAMLSFMLSPSSAEGTDHWCDKAMRAVGIVCPFALAYPELRPLKRC